MLRHRQQLHRPGERRLLEQAAAPALAHDRHGSPGSTETQFAASGSVEPCRSVGQQLRPRSLAAATTASARVLLDELGRSPAAHASGRVASCAASTENACTGPEPLRERERLERELLLPGLDEAEDHDATPSSFSTSTTRGAAAGPSPSSSTCEPCLLRDDQALLAHLVLAPRRLDPLDLQLLRAQPAGKRRVARQVDSLLAPSITAGSGTSKISQPPPSSRRTVAVPSAISMPLIPVTQGSPSAAATRIADLVVAVVGRLVAEEEQVDTAVARVASAIAAAVACGIPVVAVGLEQHRRLDAHRDRVLQLLDGRRRSERQHGRRAAVPLDEPQRLLDRALLVRADREPEVARVDRLLVGGERDPRARSPGRA